MFAAASLTNRDVLCDAFVQESVGCQAWFRFLA